MKIDQQIWQKALDLLKLRPHSHMELRRKLQTRFPDDPGMILKVLEEMERVELLNDRRFAEAYVAQLTQKPIGRLKIMVETRKRGLDADLVEGILLNLKWSELESATRAIKEKTPSLKRLDARAKKLKLIRFLKNRGFKDATIYKAINIDK